MASQISVDRDQLKAICSRWKVRELALFGSVLREDFSSVSDVDVLVSFKPGASWSLWDMMKMKEELEVFFGRKVDLVEREALRNPWRKREIVKSHEVVYAA